MFTLGTKKSDLNFGMAVIVKLLSTVYVYIVLNGTSKSGQYIEVAVKWGSTVPLYNCGYIGYFSISSVVLFSIQTAIFVNLTYNIWYHKTSRLCMFGMFSYMFQFYSTYVSTNRMLNCRIYTRDCLLYIRPYSKSTMDEVVSGLFGYYKFTISSYYTFKVILLYFPSLHHPINKYDIDILSIIENLLNICTFWS